MNKLSKDMLNYRAKNNITQKERARRANLTIQTVCHVERGIQTPSKLTEAKLRLVIGE